MKIGAETCVGMHTNETVKLSTHWWNPLQIETVDYDYLLIQSSVNKRPRSVIIYGIKLYLLSGCHLKNLCSFICSLPPVPKLEINFPQEDAFNF